MRRRRALVLMAALGIAITLAAPGPLQAATTEVSAFDFSYSPTNVTVGDEDEVRWTNNGTFSHTVTADDGSFNSGTLLPGQSFKQLFSTPGVFRYFCQFHGDVGGLGMAGIVTVEEDGTTTTSTSTTLVGDEPRIAAGDAKVAEGDSGTRTANFPVTLSQPSNSTVTVDYTTIDDSAIAPEDYKATSGSLTFPAGSVKGSVKVPIKGDTADEANETFKLKLSAPTNATIADALGVATVIDDDPGSGVRLTVGDVTVWEGDAGARTVLFTVSLSEASSSTVTVNYQTRDGTAISPGDYGAANGSVTFAPGTTSRAVAVTVKADTDVEPNETFKVVLSGVTGGATLADKTGVGTIRNDD